MRIKSILVVGMVLLLALAGLAGCSAAGAQGEGQSVNINMNEVQGIQVNAQGKVTIVPDLALLALGVSSQKSTVAEAKADVSGAMDKVMSALAEASIENKDIQTQSYSIQQVTRYDNEEQKEVVTGYRVSNMVAVKIRQIDGVGQVIDSAVNAAGDLIRVNGVRFTVENPESYYDQAREKAMTDARTKAEELAALAGVTLGKANYISENTYFPGTPYPVVRQSFGLEAPVAMLDTSISAGETDITVNVQVSYDIQ